jgi:UPF0755 protein
VIRAIRILLTLSGSLLGLFILWFALQAYPIFSSSNSYAIVQVSPGDSVAVIASKLHAAGVIGSPLAFRVDAVVQGNPTSVPGSYQFRKASSFSTVRTILNGAPNVISINARPGLTVREIAQSLATDLSGNWGSAFLSATQHLAAKSGWTSQSNLDGLIGSGTYVIAPGTTPEELASTMFARFERQAKSLGIVKTTSLEGLSAYQLVIAASIVEKEGYYSVNMPKVARVILNRLKAHQALQMDSTVLYALHRDGGQVTRAMLQTRTPYNTYLNYGLTPTPVCIPSATAFSALLHAPVGTWRYFVVVDKAGHEAFSTTYAGQLANEALARSRGL